MATPNTLYPFATQDGKAIPLDIIKSSGLMLRTFGVSAASFTIPAGVAVAALIASNPCVLRFGTTLPDNLVEDELYSDTILIPKDMVVTASVVPGTAYVKGLTSTGKLYLQFFEKWAGLALDRQFSTK
jgi:hypothetical protein